MRRNIAGQSISFKMLDVTTAAPKTTGTPAVDIVIDNGTPIVGAGTSVHKVNGSWNYLPLQAETNGVHIVFSMSLTGAISRELNVYTGTQQSVDNDTKISLIPTTPMRGSDNVPTNPALDTDYTALRAAKIDNLDALISTLATLAKQNTAQLDLDKLTGSDGATLATTQANYAPNKTVPLDAASTATLANQTTIKDRIGAFTGTGINNILGFFRSLMRSDIAVDPTDIGGTFDSTAHSNQSTVLRGDAAWITGGGGGITDSLNVKELIPMSVDLANTASIRLGLMLTNALDDLPSVAEITPGTISIDHKAIGGTAWLNVVLNVACSEINGLIYFDEVFDSASGYAEGDSLRITFKGQKITVSANDYEIIGTTGRFFYTEVRQTVGAGGSSDWTATEKENFRYRIGIDGIQTAPTNTPVLPVRLDTQGKSEVNAEADTALTDYGANKTVPLGASLTATSLKQDTAQADLDKLTGIDGATLATSQANYAPAKAGDAMTVSDKTGFSLSSAGILAIWDRLTSGFLAVGSIGKLIKDFLNVSVSSRNATPPPSVVDIRTEMDLNSIQFAGIRAKTDTIPIEIRKNAPFNNYPFAMVDLSGNFATLLTVTATKRIDSGSFVSTTNSPAEVGNGVYDINLSAADTNGKAITYRFTAPGAKDLLITVIPNP